MLGAAAIGPLPKRYRPPILDFRILGPLEVVSDEGPVVLGGPRQRATLAILLLNANRVVSVDRLADDLYAGAPPVTAVTQVQRQISELREALGDASLIETRAPGYALRLSREQFDLYSFERLTEEGGDALRRGDAEGGARLLRDALALFRGAPLADLAYEGFAQPAVARLEELRLAALEQRIDADLALGRHGELVAELEELVREQPLHEGFRGRLMLSLYRARRQAEALEIYRDARNVLVETFGIEPSPELRELERSILRQEASLELPRVAARPADAVRSLLVVASDAERLTALVSVVEPLGRLPGREIILARLVGDGSELDAAAAAVSALKVELGVPARSAAFTSTEPAHDARRMATAYDVDLVLVDAPPVFEGPLPEAVAVLMEQSPADVALLSGSAVELRTEVAVPFAGSEHDWAALELAASIALAAEVPLTLVGASSIRAAARPDASRLLADASLAVQGVAEVVARPLLVEPNERALIDAVAPMDLVVMGISPRWRRDGVGATRRALAGAARPPLLLVHAGPRPGALAPRASRTRFTWSVAGGQ